MPVLVTEHGIATENDDRRTAFIGDSLGELSHVVGDGVPVLGYLHWSLLDNFEWIIGYGPKLGLFGVDRETLARTPKPSTQVLAEFARSGRGPRV